ncbi:sugar nucleotidyltransferase [Chloroflexota bacterium]
MKNTTLKVVIPMAGLGTRLRPHTWSKPKQLVSVAGKTVFDHVIDSLSSLPDPANIELINIVGYLGDQIEDHVRKGYPEIPSHFVEQENPRGQSHAIMLARQHLQGPMLMVFADTLIETDLSFLAEERADAIAWVKPVPDPRRFGVAEVGENGWVTKLIEKPQDMDNNLVVVGFYYFSDAEALVAAIDEQMRRDIQLKGEFFLADAINIMLEGGMKMRTEKIDIWLDAGTPDAMLETNRYMLSNGRDNSREAAERQNTVFIPPVYVHPTATIESSIIGPNVSVGAGCEISQSIIKESILENQAKAKGIILEQSLVGRQASLQSRPGIVNAGDNTVVTV